MFGIFTFAIKFDFLFLGIFEVFIDLWLSFDKLAPPEYTFQKML